VFNASSGECILKFGIKGRIAGQLQRPTGVAVSPSGNYLVADYDNKWIGVYSSDGKYISRWVLVNSWCLIYHINYLQIHFFCRFCLVLVDIF